MSKRSFSVEAARTDTLKYWADLFGGKVHNNTIRTDFGYVLMKDIEGMNVIVGNIRLESPVEMKRVFTASSRYSVVITDRVRKFDSLSGTIETVAGGFVFTNIDGITTYPPGKQHILIIHIPKEKIQSLTADYPELRERILSGNRFFFESPLSAEATLSFSSITGKQLDMNRFKAEFWRILAEVFSISASGEADRYKVPDRALSAVIEAGKMLLSDFSSTPDMESIASSCGASYSYLRKYFPKVFGMSMYRYFHEHRMEHARKLLLSGRANVTEAAYQTGYTHLGHFSAEYRKYFGILPGDERQSDQSLSTEGIL